MSAYIRSLTSHSFTFLKDTAMSNAKRYEPSTAPSGVGLKGLLLYVLPMPTLVAALKFALKRQCHQYLNHRRGIFGYMVTASIARHGFKLEAEYNKRKIARPSPRIKPLRYFLSNHYHRFGLVDIRL